MGKVLIVDDELDVLLLCRINLTHAGMDVREASTGADALESALDDPPDAVVLDLMMPEMDGFEVLKHLRSHERTSEVPVLVLSARTGQVERARCAALGASDFVTKPFVPHELAEKIDDLIAGKR